MAEVQTKTINRKGQFVNNQKNSCSANLPVNELNRHVLSKIDSSSKPCQPHPHDVLFGRGNGVGKHMGNIYFHQLVIPGKPKYKSATCRADRRKIAFDIIKYIKSLDPPGRFLVPDSLSNRTWYLATESRALTKTCQALRENIKGTYVNHVIVLSNRLCFTSTSSSNASTRDDEFSSISNISDLDASEDHPKESSMDSDMLCDPPNVYQQNLEGILDLGKNGGLITEMNYQQSNTMSSTQHVARFQNVFEINRLMSTGRGRFLPSIAPIDPNSKLDSQINDLSSLHHSNISNVNKSSEFAPNHLPENTLAASSLTIVNKKAQVKAAQNSARCQPFDIEMGNSAQPTINTAENDNTPSNEDASNQKSNNPSSSMLVEMMIKHNRKVEEDFSLGKNNEQLMIDKIADVTRRNVKKTAENVLSGPTHCNLPTMNKSLNMSVQAIPNTHSIQMVARSNLPQASNGIKIENSTSKQFNSASNDRGFSPILNQNKLIEAATITSLLTTAVQAKWGKEQLAEALFNLQSNKEAVLNNSIQQATTGLSAVTSLLTTAVQAKWSKEQLAEAVFNLQSNRAALHKRNIQMLHQPAHASQDKFQAASHLCSANRSIENYPSPSECYSSSISPHAQNKDNKDATYDLSTSKEVSNETQYCQQIPDACVSSRTLTAMRASDYSILTSNEDSSPLDQNQNDSLTESSKVTSLPFSFISCDDELEDKLKKSNKHRRDRCQNDYKKCVMPLSYIGQSFSNHRLNGDVNVTDESKDIFEDLVELKGKGDSAALCLPSIVGSLCQRIIDLEEQLLL